MIEEDDCRHESAWLARRVTGRSKSDVILLAINCADLAHNGEWLPTIEQLGDSTVIHVTLEFLR
ncbi:hypothetical protein [Bradyrhizobium sp. HKCCYLR1023]|uniref:hypothetical protein n=1 Tax=Bradyrhizobium TaxID=374 RepID=UPI003EBDD549